MGLRRHSAGARTTWVCSFAARGALHPQAKAIADMFPHASQDALDLLTKLLQVRHSPALTTWQQHSIARLPQQLLGRLVQHPANAAC